MRAQLARGVGNSTGFVPLNAEQEVRRNQKRSQSDTHRVFVG